MKRTHSLFNFAAPPLLITLFTVFMIFSSAVTVKEGCSFILFQVFSVFIPGMALFQLLRIPDTDTFEISLGGYSLGYVLIIIQYFIFASANALHLLKSFQILIGAVSAFYLYRSYSRFSNKPQTAAPKAEIKIDHAIVVIFAVLVFGIRYFTYYGQNLLPSPEQNVTFPTQDILFYIGNAVSAKKGFPLEELRYAGQIFKYHYFGSIQLAVTSLVTNINALQLELSLQWTQSLLMIISTFYLLLRRMKLSKKLCALGMGIFLFSAGIEHIVYVTYQHIMYNTPFGFDIGLTLGLLFLFFIYVQYTSKHFCPGVFAGALLSYFACEGSKAPIAVVFLALAGYVCFIWLFNPQKRKWAFLFGIPLVTIFLVTFFVFVSDGFKTVTTNTTGLKIDLTGHLYECGLGRLYFEWTAEGFPSLLGKLTILLLFYFGCNMITYFLLSVMTVKSFAKNKAGLLSFESSLFIALFIGLFLTLATKQQGNSQMYFAMTSFPLALILSLKLWNTMPMPFQYKRNKLFYICSSILLLVSFLCFIHILSPSVQKGIQKIQGDDTFSANNNSLSYTEKAAYDWVRAETAPDALCVTNIILDDNQYESFIVGVCTERQMYMEGWRYTSGYIDESLLFQRKELIASFFNGKQDAQKKMKDSGADYAIWVKRYGSPSSDWATPFGTKVFENEAVSVYKLD